MISFGYWLRFPCPNIALNREGSAQISKNLEQFLHFEKFWHKKQEILPYALCHVALAFSRGLQIPRTENLDLV